MAEFSVRSDSVNVEQIMEQIRSRIREKRGVDYTEEQIRELAAVKLQKFLDPRGVRSDLLEQFRKTQPSNAPPELPNFVFEGETLFESNRGWVRSIRKLLNPILKLFFNPNPLIMALHVQSELNTRVEAQRRSTDSLYYELIHNLVVETTRLGIDVKNLSMRIESMSSRLEFNERRARALESAVVYRPGPGDIVVTAAHSSPSGGSDQRPPQSPSNQQQARPQTPQHQQSHQRPPQQAQPQQNQQQGPQQGQPTDGAPGEGPGQRSRRRRRRRGRRGGGSATSGSLGSQGSDGSQGSQGSEGSEASPVQQRPEDSTRSDNFEASTTESRPSAPEAAPEPPPAPSSSSHEPDAQ